MGITVWDFTPGAQYISVIEANEYFHDGVTSRSCSSLAGAQQVYVVPLVHARCAVIIDVICCSPMERVTCAIRPSNFNSTMRPIS